MDLWRRSQPRKKKEALRRSKAKNREVLEKTIPPDEVSQPVVVSYLVGIDKIGNKKTQLSYKSCHNIDNRTLRRF